jgi:hypothetical protein
MRSKNMQRWLLFVVTALGLTVLTSSLQASEMGARSAAFGADRLLRGAGYDFVSGDAGRLAYGQSTVVHTTLYRGNTYAFIAGGCEDAYDVDIAVYDENGNLIRRDNDNSAAAVAEGIVPRWTGKFYIKVTMYRSTSDGAHYILLLGRR